jgi:CheY-like chemotaxis protein
VCRRIRTWSDVPIVVLSADGSEDRKADALDQGADQHPGAWNRRGGHGRRLAPARRSAQYSPATGNLAA